MPKDRKPAGAPPTEAKLHEAALAHLARFAATEAGLRRVLHRRIDRWLRAAEQEGQEPEDARAAARAAKQAAGEVANKLVAAGAVDDAAFAASRARRLARTGRSRRAIAAHLAAKGVVGEAAQAALPGDELDAALALCRRRRLGPFATAPQERLKAMGVLARAGFPRDIAEQALDMDPAAAEERLLALRSG